MPSWVVALVVESVAVGGDDSGGRSHIGNANSRAIGFVEVKKHNGVGVFGLLRIRRFQLGGRCGIGVSDSIHLTGEIAVGVVSNGRVDDDGVCCGGEPV